VVVSNFQHNLEVKIKGEAVEKQRKEENRHNQDREGADAHQQGVDGQLILTIIVI